MKKSRLLGAVYAAIFVLITDSTNAAILPLESRLDGLAYYDPNLDITWVADANINGVGTWDNQMAWVAGLTLGGVSGWRLPSADVNGDGTVVDCFGGGITGCVDNEMGYLFWEEGIMLSAQSPFNNIQDSIYWTNTDSLITSDSAWIFRFLSDIGDQRTFNKTVDIFSAWAVYDGDVAIAASAVPVPAAFWLFGSGLLGLIGISRRKKLF